MRKRIEESKQSLLARAVNSRNTSERAGHLPGDQEAINIWYQETESKSNVFLARVFTKRSSSVKQAMQLMFMTKGWVKIQKDKNKPEIAKNIYTLVSQLHMPISTPSHVKK